MKRYANTHDGAIQSVEISVKPESLQACLRLRDADSVKPVSAKLEKMGFTILSETKVGTQPMLVAIGPRSESDFITQLSAIDGPLTDKGEKKPFDAWKVRSYLGFGGQILQLASGFMKHKLDKPLVIFAATNLTANGINLAYKAQKHDDPHQLRVLKQAINERLTPHLAEGLKAIPVDDNRGILRERNRPHPAEPFNDFMRKNSVNVGELGLRYFGAISLAAPARDWPAAMKEGRLPKLDSRPLRVFTGTTSVIGKTIATTSKIPDPYNPKQPGWLGRIREKYSFLTGGLVEAVAFSALTYDSLMHTAPKMVNGKLENVTGHSLIWRGKPTRDWLGAIGGAMFVTGYIVRSWAKFGVRNVDVPELVAHTSDMLSRLPPDQIPQALADTSAYLANHFKGQQGLTFGNIYAKLSDDLGHEHHIMINPRSHHLVIARDPSTGVEVTQVHPNNEIQTGNVEHSAPQPAPQHTVASL